MMIPTIEQRALFPFHFLVVTVHDRNRSIEIQSVEINFGKIQLDLIREISQKQIEDILRESICYMTD